MAIFSAIAYGLAYAGGFLAASAGFSVATAVKIGVAVSKVGGALVAAGISQLLAPKVSIPQQEIQASISQTDAPRRVYFGENLAGGVRALYDVKEAVLYQLVMVAHGRISEFVAFWIDGSPVELNAAGEVFEGSKAGFVTCETRDGSAFGGDYQTLINTFTSWDATRKLEEQATFMAAMKAPVDNDFNKIFPKAFNTVLQWVIRGQEIYDPRTSLAAYGDNAALAITHFLRHDDGYKLTQADVNWESVTAMADVCDVAVPQLAGGTEPSLRLWGYWTLDETPSAVLDRMAVSCGIRPYEMQDGRIGLIGGNYGTPACTITAKDIKSIQTVPAISEREGFNVLNIFHMDADQRYTVTEVDAWRDETRLAIEGEIAQELRMELCPNRSQARRLGKKRLHDDNRATVEIVTNLVGLKARYPKEHGQRHTILLDYQPEDGSGRVIQGEYEVTDHEFDPVECECLIKLARVDRTSEAWTIAEEGAAPPPLLEGEGNLAPAISAVLTQRIVQISAGSSQAILDVDAVPIPDRSDIELRARYRKTGATAWIDMQATDYSAVSGAVEDGEEYEAQARFAGVFDEPDTWIDLGPITIQIDATAPDQPSGLNAGLSMAGVLLTWRNPTSAFFAVRVYRSTGTDFATASLLGQTGGVSGQVSEYEDETAAATTEYNYWVAAVNVSGVEGAPDGPESITTV